MCWRHEMLRQKLRSPLAKWHILSRLTTPAVMAPDRAWPQCSERPSWLEIHPLLPFLCTTPARPTIGRAARAKQGAPVPRLTAQRLWAAPRTTKQVAFAARWQSNLQPSSHRWHAGSAAPALSRALAKRRHQAEHPHAPSSKAVRTAPLAIRPLAAHRTPRPASKCPPGDRPLAILPFAPAPCNATCP